MNNHPNTNHQFSQEELLLWLSGEGDGALSSRIETALQDDPALLEEVSVLSELMVVVGRATIGPNKPLSIPAAEVVSPLDPVSDVRASRVMWMLASIAVCFVLVAGLWVGYGQRGAEDLTAWVVKLDEADQDSDAAEPLLAVTEPTDGFLFVEPIESLSWIAVAIEAQDGVAE